MSKLVIDVGKNGYNNFIFFDGKHCIHGAWEAENIDLKNFTITIPRIGTVGIKRYYKGKKISKCFYQNYNRVSSIVNEKIDNDPNNIDNFNPDNVEWVVNINSEHVKNNQMEVK